MEIVEAEQGAATTEDAAGEAPCEPGPDQAAGSGKPKAKAPEVEIHLFRRGRAPPAVFRSQLGGWDQDRLEVQDILDKHGLKSLFAFNPASGRGVPIRFSPRNGRSFLPYADGAVIFVDGEPQDSLVKPVTKILVGVAVITILVALVAKETPDWLKASRFSSGNWNFPPWILACVVIVFTRGRKRTRDLLKRYGWLR
ncbi:hypothetical protein Taro_048337 [Colocasia esculenta]|uniref:Uncharacterized protein n=1 Tax=Colocasia esculenta TaxID=4460 RepID=A0A843X863_COLES|nr:hypothetical protein [Colocasia esculenta]